MSYTPTIIDTGDYEDVRLCLGLDATDTTTLSADVIEGRMFLRHTEAEVKQRVTTWATILSGGGDKSHTLKGAVVAWTASRIAALYLAARVSEEVERVAVGPYTTQYRKGPDWAQVASDLADTAAELFARVQTWSASPSRITMVGLSGPTRRRETAETQMTSAGWREYLEPPVVRGHVYTESPEDSL